MNMTFDTVAYRGSFREDQKRLLRRVRHRSENPKIHLVTPPGSDWQALGLEILREFATATLILSATSASCESWKARFVADFLPASELEEKDSYFSCELGEPALMTAITYETLANAFSQSGSRGGDGKGLSHADVVRYVHSCGIRTILLDDPHHIGDTGLGALESFFGVLGGEVRIVTMNTVLPYDARPEDWNRMVAICGDVDLELLLPELVGEGVLCPHQDYVYVNYPTEQESEGIRGYRVRADMAVTAVMDLPFASELNRRLVKLTGRRNDYADAHRNELGALLRVMADTGHMVHPRLVKLIHGRASMQPMTLACAEQAFQFLLDSHNMLKTDEREELRTLLADYRVLDHDRVRLSMTGKVRRTLLSSLGKHESVAAIVAAEREALGARLRAVVLTDVPEVEELSIAGTEEELVGIGMVSIFEGLRRRFADLSMGCVSCEAVILPVAVSAMLSRDFGRSVKTVPIGETGYAFYRFDDNDEMLESLQVAFAAGDIQVLVASTDLMDGRWDYAFVNTLIVTAHRIGFAALHRIRGRVLAAEPGDADKAAHIWHLATVERTYSLKENPELRLASRMVPGEEGRGDVELEVLRRYFTCFLGPNETGPGLVSGIDRLGDMHTPESEEELAAMNAAVLTLAADRARLIEQWKTAVVEPEPETIYGNICTVPEVYVPKASKLPIFTPGHIVLLLLAAGCLVLGFATFPMLLEFCFMSLVFNPAILVITIVLTIISGLILLWGIVFTLHVAPLLILHLSPRLSIRVRCRAILKAMKSLDLIDKDAVFVMENAPDGMGYRIYVHSCILTQQTAFQMAVSEMFSAMENPRYLVVRAGFGRRLLWRWSFACPSVIARNDVSVKTFSKYIRLAMGMVKFQYTHRELGRKYLFYARNLSYLNTGHRRCERRVRRVWIAEKPSKYRREE